MAAAAQNHPGDEDEDELVDETSNVLQIESAQAPRSRGLLGRLHQRFTGRRRRPMYGQVRLTHPSVGWCDIDWCAILRELRTFGLHVRRSSTTLQVLRCCRDAADRCAGLC